jgi:uncharacterized protein YdeI (YjbR/CyaY-like superfamily)
VGAIDAAEVEPQDATAWREWLARNHAIAGGVWLVYRKPSSGTSSLTYEAAVEEALCFGWVDGMAGRVDDERTKLYFAPRKPGSGWARTNKDRVARLIGEGRMAPAGLRAIEVAKANGSWTLLDAAERLEVPDDLARALDARPPARAHWDGFSPSARKLMLTWVVTARRPETRAKRVDEIAAAAERNERAR